MGVAFNTGQELGRNDLNIFLVNEYGVPVNAAKVTYAIYYVDKSGGEPGVEVLIGPPERTPVNPAVGEYYAALLVPPGAAAGDYRIRWKIQKTANGPIQEVVQEFAVVAPVVVPQGGKLYSPCEADLVDKLRIMLRDNNPDRNYRFRPPEQEGVIHQYNAVFGQIWQDYELYTYLELALGWFNSMPPETEEIASLNLLCQLKPSWRTFVLWGAAVHALFALSINWAADEFSVAPDTLVRVYLPDGRPVDLPISELHEIVMSPSPA